MIIPPRPDKRIFKSLPWWMILPVVLLLLCILTGFNGMYGQDSFEYLRYTRQLHHFIVTGNHPGIFPWPPLYPLTGALLSFLLPDIFTLQLISLSCFGLSTLYMEKIFRLLFPEKTAGIRIYLFLFFVMSPFVIRYTSTVMSDAMTLLFILIAFYYFLTFMGEGRNSHFLVQVLFTFCAINTRYAAFFILVIPGIIALYRFIRSFSISWFLLTVLTAGIIFLPVILLSLAGSTEISGVAERLKWSSGNWFSNDFINIDGHFHYPVINILYAFSGFVHPGYIFPGIVFLLPGLRFLYHKGHEVCLPAGREDTKRHEGMITRRKVYLIILLMILCYGLFLAGISFQALRFLLLTFPFILILLFNGFMFVYEKIRIIEMNHRPDPGEFTEKLTPSIPLSYQERGKSRFIGTEGGSLTYKYLFYPLIALVLIIQAGLAYRAVLPFYNNCRETRIVAESLKKYPGRHIYELNISMSFDAYGVKNSSTDLWSKRITFFETGSLLVFNYSRTAVQWKGLNPMLSYETLQRDHRLRRLEHLPGGWDIYEITE